MAESERTRITVETIVSAEPERVWDCWTLPEHIVRWNQASADWHTTRAENDLRAGGKFLSRMEAKDGSFGYQFSGTIQELREMEKILSRLDDGRSVEFHFVKIDDGTTKFTMLFEPETKNTRETQKRFWDVVLNNFEKYVEKQK